MWNVKALNCGIATFTEVKDLGKLSTTGNERSFVSLGLKSVKFEQCVYQSSPESRQVSPKTNKSPKVLKFVFQKFRLSPGLCYQMHLFAPQSGQWYNGYEMHRFIVFLETYNAFYSSDWAATLQPQTPATV